MSDVDQGFDEDHEFYEYADVPEDPEKAFIAMHEREYEKFKILTERTPNSRLIYARQYVDTMIVFDRVYGLETFTDFGEPPVDNSQFSHFYFNFLRRADMSSKQIKMEAARRLKTGVENIVILETSAREVIHKLINAIREKLNEFDLPENKRDSLFNKLNAFAAEVDRNRTRTEAFYALVVDTGRAVGEASSQFKPLKRTFDRILDQIDNAKKWHAALPPPVDKKLIEGPQNNVESLQQDVDDEIQF